MSSSLSRNLLLVLLASWLILSCAAKLVDEPEERGANMAAADLVMEKLVDQARGDLAEKLSIGQADVKVVRAERVTWRDSGLGCPEPETSYMQMLTPGVLIELKARGKVYPYHGSLQGPPKYCEHPSPAGPLPADEP